MELKVQNHKAVSPRVGRGSRGRDVGECPLPFSRSLSPAHCPGPDPAARDSRISSGLVGPWEPQPKRPGTGTPITVLKGPQCGWGVPGTPCWPHGPPCVKCPVSSSLDGGSPFWSPASPPSQSPQAHPSAAVAHCVAAQRLPCWSFKNVQNGCDINKKGGLAPVLRPSPGMASWGPSQLLLGPGVLHHHLHTAWSPLSCAAGLAGTLLPGASPMPPRRGYVAKSPRHTAQGPESPPGAFPG